MGFTIFCHGRLVRALIKCNSCNDKVSIINGAPNRKDVTKDTELQFLKKGGRSSEVFGWLGDINVFREPKGSQGFESIDAWEGWEQFAVTVVHISVQCCVSHCSVIDLHDSVTFCHD